NDNGELGSSEDNTNTGGLTISEATISEKLDDESSFTVEEAGTTYEIAENDNQGPKVSTVTASSEVVRDFCVTRDIYKGIPVDLCFTLYECGAQVELDLSVATGSFDLPCGETKCKEEEYDVGFGTLDWEICQEPDGDIVVSYDGWVWHGTGTKDVSDEIKITR
ncbi:hypothetical protein, partial [Natrinema sp. JCM 9743]